MDRIKRRDDKLEKIKLDIIRTSGVMSACCGSAVLSSGQCADCLEMCQIVEINK